MEEIINKVEIKTKFGKYYAESSFIRRSEEEMACQFNCGCCSKLIKSTSVAVTGTAPNQVLTITIPTQTLSNLDEKCLVIAQTIPANADSLPVVILNGATVIPVRVKTGNNLRADQLRCRRRYPLIYGNDPIHFSLEVCVPKTSFVVV